MKARAKAIYEVTQYLKRGDHPNEYVWSSASPILDEIPGKRWPASGRIGTLDECNPDDLRYSVFATAEKKDNEYFKLGIGWWILERNGRVVATRPPDVFARDFELMETP